MTPESRELLRNTLLLAANKALPNGLTQEALTIAARVNGFKGVSPDEIRTSIEYLVGKHLLAPIQKLISPEISAWKVTADGQDYLATEGLA